MRILFAVSMVWLGLTPFLTAATAEVPPRWWGSPVTSIKTANSANNFALANLGQLKFTARKAKHYLDRSLASQGGQGGAGLAITQCVLAFEPRSNQGYTPTQIADLRRANLTPVTLGQAKAVAKLYYDRLVAVSYNTKQSLVRNGYAANWAYNYPWNPSTPISANYAPLNLGQLKLLFSFEFDVDRNGLDDNWELEFFSQTGQSPIADPDGDGLSNQQESDLWTNPTVWTDVQRLDSNGDGISDVESLLANRDPYELDSDDDGVINARELTQGTNPFSADTDGDGIIDGLDSTAGPGDSVPPLIVLNSPTNATLVP